MIESDQPGKRRRYKFAGQNLNTAEAREVAGRLKHQAGLTQQEIAGQLGTTQGTVSKWIGRTRFARAHPKPPKSAPKNHPKPSRAMRYEFDGHRIAEMTAMKIARKLKDEHGLTSADIAYELNAPASKVTQWLSGRAIESRMIRDTFPRAAQAPRVAFSVEEAAEIAGTKPYKLKMWGRIDALPSHVSKAGVSEMTTATAFLIQHLSDRFKVQPRRQRLSVRRISNDAKQVASLLLYGSARTATACDVELDLRDLRGRFSSRVREARTGHPGILNQSGETP